MKKLYLVVMVLLMAHASFGQTAETKNAIQRIIPIVKKKGESGALNLAPFYFLKTKSLSVTYFEQSQTFILQTNDGKKLFLADALGHIERVVVNQNSIKTVKQKQLQNAVAGLSTIETTKEQSEISKDFPQIRWTMLIYEPTADKKVRRLETATAEIKTAGNDYLKKIYENFLKLLKQYEAGLAKN